MSEREQGAKLLHEMCNTDDPQEQERLARELPIPANTLRQLFAERDATEPGSEAEDQVVERIVEAVFSGTTEPTR
jgi:hypothetical protein